MQGVQVSEEPMLLTIEETMKKLRVGRSKLYRMMGEGMPVFRSGRYVRIPADLLHQWIRERAQRSA